MRTANRSRSALFLIELMLAVAFFALAAAVCVRLFAQAHLLSSSSFNLGRSVSAATAAASCFKSAGPDPEGVALLLGGEAEGEVVRAYYDRGWQPVEAADQGGFTLTMNFYSRDGVDYSEIIVLRESDSDVVYALRTARYPG